jgi:hypothetical protein
VSEADPLHWEATARPRAAASALLAGLLTIAGSAILLSAGSADSKDTTSQLLFVHAHASAFRISGTLIGLGALAMAYPLYVLYRATRARREQLPAAVGFLTLLAPVLTCVYQVAFQFVLLDRAGHFATQTDTTYQAAKRLIDHGVLPLIRILGVPAQLAMGFAFVFVCLQAMRAGLLTRFMGYIGIITGVLFVIPLGPLPVIQAFWLIALAFLLVGRWPNPLPAWSTGRAEPWPTQQQIREARREAAGEPGGPQAADGPQSAPEPDGDGEVVAAGPARPAHPASRKRKRKKRR